MLSTSYPLCFGVLLFFSSATAVANGASDLTPAAQSLARDYVLAACIMERYKETPLAAEADSWAGGLVERGSLPAEAYPALVNLAHSAPKPGVNRDGTTMLLQSCVDFINTRDFPVRLRRVLQKVMRK